MSNTKKKKLKKVNKVIKVKVSQSISKPNTSKKKVDAKKKKTTTKKPYNQTKIFSAVYNVWISGVKLAMAKKQCISSIDIKETVEGSDVATLKINDPEFLFIDDDIFIEENTIKIVFGFEGFTYRHKFTGYISAVDIDFGSNGTPVLTLTCMDKTHRMNRKKKNRTFKNTTSAAVVTSILKNYGYVCHVEGGYPYEKQETITQSNQTDIEFVTKLASDEIYPHTSYLTEKDFYYKKMGNLSGDPKLELTYRKYPHEIISFSPKINKETKQVEIKTSSVSTGSKKISSSTGTSSVKQGSSSSSGGSNKGSGSSKKSGGGSYTYDPTTKKWNKN